MHAQRAGQHRTHRTGAAAVSTGHTRRIWAPAEDAMLHRQYATTRTQDLATALGRTLRSVYDRATKLGLHKATEFKAAMTRAAISNPAHPGRKHLFGANAPPWNKGLKGITGTHPNSRRQQYRRGNISGRAAQLCKPINTLRIGRDGLLERKVCDTPGPTERRWHPVHRLVWQAAHGPVPAGHIVFFKVGRKSTELDDSTLEAVELVTRAENMRRNSVHTQYPPELARLVQLRGALQRQINRKTRNPRDE